MTRLQVQYAKEMKINYKNGGSYRVKNVTMVSVDKTIGGGHDISYTRDMGSWQHNYDDGIVYTDLQNVATSSEDVVSIELKNAMINGVKLDRVKKVFK